MTGKIRISRLRAWLKNIPIQDPVDNQMAALLQVMLFGLIAVFFAATLVNLFLTTDYAEILINSLINITIFGIPLILLRRGYFRMSIYYLIALFLIIVTAVILAGDLRSEAETLTFFTLGILLAGLLIGQRALIITFTISSAIVLFIALREQDPTLRLDYISIAGDFVLLDGLMSFFINSFGVTLRNSLRASLQRENDLKEEITVRQKVETDLQNALEREQHLKEVTSTISSKLDLNTILSTVVQLTAELVEADAGAMSLVNPDGKTISHHNLYNLPENLELKEPVPRGTGNSWRVIETRQSMLLDDYTTLSHGLPNWKATNLHSLIEVPLIVGDSCLGTLSVAKKNPDFHFSDRDLALVESVARQTAIAIQNARFIEAQQHELAERIRIEREREDLIDKLEEQNDELTRFTYTVSHDLRSPLVTIKGFIGMLNQDIKNNRSNKIQNDLERIAGAAEKMDALLSELLELSRIGRIANPPEKIDTIQLIRDAIESVDARIRSRNVTLDVMPDIPQLYGDCIRLREVFENLIDNAIKYMGNQDLPVIEIGARNQSDETILYVKDNGMGIEKQYQEKIFGLFEKLDSTVDGTGIGLALVKRIIETHGGRIWVESEGLGKGSTFCFTLPDKRE